MYLESVANKSSVLIEVQVIHVGLVFRDLLNEVLSVARFAGVVSLGLKEKFLKPLVVALRTW